MPLSGRDLFSDDDASDFIADIVETEDLSLVRAALDIPLDEADYLELPEAARVLVAAEVIAKLRGDPSMEMPSVLEDWTDGLEIAEPDSEDIAQAKRAVERVLRNSEMRDLYSESPKLALEWERTVASLLSRL